MHHPTLLRHTTLLLASLLAACSSPTTVPPANTGNATRADNTIHMSDLAVFRKGWAPGYMELIAGSRYAQVPLQYTLDLVSLRLVVMGIGAEPCSQYTLLEILPTQPKEEVWRVRACGSTVRFVLRDDGARPDISAGERE